MGEQYMKTGELFEIPMGIRVTETDPPAPGPGEFVVAVKACGVCSSDVKMAKRGHPILDLYGLPFVGGHEFSGEVTEVTKQVEQVRPGDRVVVSWINPCLECYYCKRGLTQFCVRMKDTLIQPAGFSEQVTIPASHQETRIFPFSSSLDYEKAALTEPLACALNGIDQAGITAGDTVVILGAGFMGQLLMQLAHLQGASEIAVIDSIQKRLSLATELGVDHAINFNEHDPVEFVMNITDGYGADVVIEATGVLEAYRKAVGLGRKGSTVLYFGGLPGGLSLDIDPNMIHYKQVTLKGSYSYTIDTFRRALKLLEHDRVKTDKLITHRFPLEKLEEAILMSAGSESMKVMIRFD
jgi:L-iditol 2-dehydrogenase